MNNTGLGNLILDVLKHAYPEPAEVAEPTRDQIVVSVAGLSFTGKMRVSQRLCQEFGF